MWRAAASASATRWVTWLFVFCGGLSSALSNAQVPIPPLTGHIIDQTHTLTEAQQQQIEASLAAFELRKGSQVAVLLVATTQPETIEQYALRVAEQWQLGRKKVDDGAILVIAKNDRTVRIEVGYGLEGALNDATCKRIIEELISPRFRQQDFEGGIAAGVQRMMRVIEGEPLPAPASDKSAEALTDLTGILVAGALLGFVLRAIFGRGAGSIMTAALVGTATWFVLGVLSLALTASVVTMLTTWLGITGLLRARYGGRGGPGGGFRGGGGGGFGGGGASGRW
ncbi:YgcG family protein [Limnohabitans sp.]|uniref:TPM domain-containing protein n=1 Tax=Limnohabitans sp. TaxID=1907725 RepID=UPI00286ED933|nr:YgcG family protein [Limnohabitans sp.]